MTETDEKILEELRRIREVLEPKTSPPPVQGIWNEFIEFLSNYRVIELQLLLSWASIWAILSKP